LWGQTDSIYAFFVLASFLALHRKRMVLSIFLFVVSVLTKPTSFFVFPVFALWWVKGAKLKDYYWSIIVLLVTTVFLYLPFHKSNLVPWIINFYKDSLGGELDYIVANAFNFWGLVHGFDNVSEAALFLGLPSNIVGYFAFAIFAFWILLLFRGRNKFDTAAVLFLAALSSFAAFLILPRIHERYFYPTLLFLVPLAATNVKLRRAFYLLSGIHLINLYHFWWVPRIDFLINLFSIRAVEQLLIITNMTIFVYLVGVFKHRYAKET
jgi:Gpi18-like mannosyltransferase